MSDEMKQKWDELRESMHQVIEENRELLEQLAAAKHDLSLLSSVVVESKAENAKLRGLRADMYGFIKRMDEDCGDVTFSDCFDYCKHDTADDGCCKTGECWYEQRLRELGVEVDE